ncbi:MAG: agmatinase, partial [Pseudomonadota bacterium]
MTLPSPQRAHPHRANHGAGLRARRAPSKHHHPDFNAKETKGWKALEKEDKLSGAGWAKEQRWALEMGLPGAASLEDKSIPTFSRGELPHFAGINTLLKAPYVENVRDVAKYDAAVIGVPF